LSIIGLATFDAGTGSINLGAASNNFGSLNFTGGAVLVTEASHMDLSGANSATTLALTGAGIDDGSSATLVVSGAATVTAGANDITLDNANDFSTLTIGSADNVRLNDVSGIDLGGTTSAIASLVVTSAGAITDSGSLDVTGNAAFTATSITLGGAGKTTNFGSLTLNAPAATIQEDSGTDFTGSNVVATLSLSSGGISDGAAGSLTVTTATFDAGSGDIALDNAGNDFGTVTVTSANDVSLTDANAIVLGGIEATDNGSDTGDLSIVATGISATGLVNVEGATTLTAGTGDVALGGGNDFGGPVTVVSSHTTVLGDVNDLLIGSITASNSDATIDSVVLTAGGSILDGHADGNAEDGATVLMNITALNLTVNTVGAFGDAADRVELAVPGPISITTSGAAGSVFLQLAGPDPVMLSRLTIVTDLATEQTVDLLADAIVVDTGFGNPTDDLRLVSFGTIKAATKDPLVADDLTLEAINSQNEPVAIGSTGAPLVIDVTGSVNLVAFVGPAPEHDPSDIFGFVQAGNFDTTAFNDVFERSNQHVFVIGNFDEIVSGVLGSFISAPSFTVDSSQFRTDLNIFGVEGAGFLLPGGQCDDEESTDCAQ
jgi:hypothetical protein